MSFFFKTFDSEFSYFEVWSIDQNSKPLEIDDKINISKNLSSKYSQKLLDHAKQSATDALKTAS